MLLLHCIALVDVAGWGINSWLLSHAQGKFLVLGGLKAMNGQLEFISADDFETLNAAEHFMCTNVEWDPTGRFVATSVTSIHQMENGFNVWLFNGTLLYRRAPPLHGTHATQIPLCTENGQILSVN